jgi:hypothetical protein
VGLAVLAEVRAVGVDDGRRVVEDAVLLALVDRQDHHHGQLGGQGLEPLDRRAVGHLLGVVVVGDVLHLAEVGPVEELLEADDLGPLRRGGPGLLLVEIGHRRLVTGPLGLDDGGPDDVGHAAVPPSIVSCAHECARGRRTYTTTDNDFVTYCFVTVRNR